MNTPARIRDGNDPDAIAQGASILTGGGLVAFPTETVYGLGANATNDAAVAKIFQVKGRPPSNPIIVHVFDIDSARACTTTWNERAQRLAEAFWPGPMTLVVPGHASISRRVSAGGETVGLRCPRHPVARALLGAFGGPIAAPSANRFMAVSPTRAQHVEEELGDAVALILDGGPCEIGIESTVIDVVLEPRILRQGHIVASQIAAVLGEPVPIVVSHVQDNLQGEPPLLAPGQFSRHYAPKKPVFLGSIEGLAVRASVVRRAALLSWSRTHLPQSIPIVLPNDPSGYAREIYRALREADQMPVDEIWVERPPDVEAWSAVLDRLERAASKGHFR